MLEKEKEICVITSDLGYMKFGPVWTDLFVDRSMTGALEKIIKNFKNLKRARTLDHTITERSLKPLGHLRFQNVLLVCCYKPKFVTWEIPLAP